MTPDAVGTTEKAIRRWQVLRRLVNLYPDSRYLEIGVSEGVTFDRVPATLKVAVDPHFQFDHELEQRERPEAAYHQVTSDEYFERVARPDDEFDVIYLDGLHQFDQTLRDLLNALERLQPKGVIVIDDTRPPSYLASIRDRDQYFRERTALGVTDKSWMGDVFKVVYFIQSFCPHLRYATIANNHGQTVVWRGRRDVGSARDLADIAGMEFEDLQDSQEVLRLKRFGAIRREVRRELGL